MFQSRKNSSASSSAAAAADCGGGRGGEHRHPDPSPPRSKGKRSVTPPNARFKDVRGLIALQAPCLAWLNSWISDFPVLAILICIDHITELVPSTSSSYMTFLFLRSCGRFN